MAGTKKTDKLREALGGTVPFGLQMVPMADPMFNPQGGLGTGTALDVAIQRATGADPVTRKLLDDNRKKKAPAKTNPIIVEKLKPELKKEAPKKTEEAPVAPAEEKSSFDLNRLGLILSGGLSSLGAGIAGADQARANQIAMANLSAYDQEKDNQKYEDPNSEESKQARKLFDQLYRGRVQMPENMTAAQFRQQSPVFDKILQRRMMELRPAKAKELAKPILDAKQIERLDNAKRLKATTEELAAELESGNGIMRMLGLSPESDRNRLADDITSYKAVLQGQGQAGEGQIKAGRENYATPGTLELSSTKAKKVRDEGEKFYRDEIQKLKRQGFVAKEINGVQMLVHPDTGEYLEL